MTTSPICVDASIVLRLLVADPLSPKVAALFAGWRDQDRTLVAPMLLCYEVVNASHRLVRAGRLKPSTAERVVAAAIALPITLFAGPELFSRALALARELRLPSAYDAAYLAVAEAQECDLVTTDRRLANAAGSAFPRILLVT